SAFGQWFTVLHSFWATQSTPFCGLTAAPDGKVYGTTGWGGLYGRGNVFVLTPDGNGSYDYAEIYYAKPEDGVGGLLAPLLLASDGNFYGTAMQDAVGTVFRIDASGQLTRLHVFSQSEGVYPSSLREGDDGYFYGAALAGGQSDIGTVFRMDTSGNVAALQSFSGSNGASPTQAGLGEGSDGAFYGLTWSGGAAGLGTVFRFSFAEGLTTLHSFTGPGRASPRGEVCR